ncbi:MAG TPA: MFS transporter [Stellaceae bacterium]|nr:MFS transporter [Stellaceae bacterium]
MTDSAIPRKTPSRLPFFYGWLLVAVAFVTMAVGVNARTAFSLLYPPILKDFGWDRGLTAGIFSFGFLLSALITPLAGRLIDRRGPRLIVEIGIVTLGAGLLLATLAQEPWQLYLTLGAMCGAGVNCFTYTTQSIYLPHWFVRRRGLAISIAFSGVGIGSITILPWLQYLIGTGGWRAGCWMLGILVVALLGPINLLLRHRPEEMGLEPDGEHAARVAANNRSNIVDPAWAAIEWTLGRALKTSRFWWLALGYFGSLFAWYAVQVHQTKYLTEIGFSATGAAWALGLVSLVAVPGQIALGHLSDRIGREWIWAIGNGGFVLCYLALIALKMHPTMALLWAMVIAQGTLGYSLTSVMGPIPAEIFAGKHQGSIFGVVMLSGIIGGAAGPWVAGTLHDLVGSYAPTFWVCIGLNIVSAAAIWRAAPRKVRAVAGRVPLIPAHSSSS